MDHDSFQKTAGFFGFDTTRLEKLIISKEDWLLERLTAYVIERGFGKYVPPLIESWRLAVAGVSESILIGIRELVPDFELGPDDDYTKDPVSRFAMLEAHRHRERGISLNMFLGLLTYFKQIFLDLVQEAAFEPAYERCCSRAIERLFDRMVIAISVEWAQYDKGRMIEDLQANNRLMTNEKNKYLSIFESHPHLVFILDHDHRIDNMNHAAARLFHKAKLPGSQYYRVVTQGGATVPLLRVAQDAQAGGSVEKVACKDLFPWLTGELTEFSGSSDLMRDFEKKVDGEEGPQYYNVKLSRTIDAGKELRGIILVIEDITAKIMVSEELRQAKDRAERANRAKSVFLANISHELRTPLNAILGFAGLMKKSQETTPDQATHLEIISSSGENLLNLINNVLDISKIEAGHMVREDVDIDLKRFLDDLTALMSIKVSEKGLTLDTVLVPDLPGYIAVDSGKLRQVLTNLIANAVKYTENGGIRLSVKVLESDGSGRTRLHFEVADTGKGISKEDQSIIFDPFQQIGDQPSSEAGTGLGLAICKQYTALMDGCIGVRSEPGKGSVFFVDIPVKVLATSQKRPSTRCERIVGLEPGQRGYRILIAEDQIENRLLLRTLLAPFGFELYEAGDGQEAVALFEQHHPDFVWMDIRMPVMSGLEATRHIRGLKTGRDAKIVALTAHALEEERMGILAAGCDAVIRKPYRDTEIYLTLADHLGVRFLYEMDTTPAERPSVKAPVQEKIQQIPPPLVENLQKAVVLLDKNQCAEAIDKIRDHDPLLGDHFHHMVENLQYREILAALDPLAGGEQR